MSKIADLYTRALVTGGAGFIGSHICEELLNEGIEVVSLDDYSAGKKKNHTHLDSHPKFKAVSCDITNFEELKKHFEGVDIVFHNAASKKNICLKDPRRDLEVNAKGVFNLLDLARQFGVKKFVHASTGSVYGEAVELPQTEDHPLNPASYYGVSKLAGEKYVSLFHKLFGMNTTVLRYFHVFGPRQESNEFGGVVPIFVRNMVNGEQPVIFGDGTQERSFTYVKDVAKANLLVAVNPRSAGQVYNCASGVSVTINELADFVIDHFGKKGEVVPRHEDWLVGDIKKFGIDNARLRALGMEFETDFFVRLPETIDATVEYLNR